MTLNTFWRRRAEGKFHDLVRKFPEHWLVTSYTITFSPNGEYSRDLGSAATIRACEIRNYHTDLATGAELPDSAVINVDGYVGSYRGNLLFYCLKCMLMRDAQLKRNRS